jgi:capsular polysaccharide biosynthesis protein
MIDHSSQSALGKIQANFGLVVVITLGFVLIGVGVSLALPKQYRVESRLVVIQNASIEVDSYTAQRSVESNVALLIDLAYTDSFFSRVVGEDVAIRERFPLEDIRRRRQLFRRNVIIDTPGRGFINVLTYDESAEVAEKINRSVLNNLVSEGVTILGENARITTVNQPSLYDGIGRPNILLNLSGAAILGVAISVLYILTKKQKTTYEAIDDFGVPSDSSYDF